VAGLAGRREPVPLALALLVSVLVLAGCIGGPSGGGDGSLASDLTVVIDFEGFEPDTHPGRLAQWMPDGAGGWRVETQDRAEGAWYVVDGVSARTVLDALVAAADATGLEVVYHKEAMGAFVDSVDGVENGEDGHWWSYYVNDEYGQEAADRADVSDGDEVRWVYMGSPFG